MNRPLRPLRRLRPAVRSRRTVGRGEDGFILMESIVAIGLITVILAALGGMTLRSVTATDQLRARQAAVQVATSTMAVIDSLPASDLLYKRDKTSSDSQWAAAAANAQVSAALASMTEAYDRSTTAVSAGTTAPVSTSTQTQTLNNIAYSVNTYLGTCVTAGATPTVAATPDDTPCVVSGAAGVTYLRAVVAVTWTGRGCGTAGFTCTYVTSTLINSDTDPVFNTNKATPPTAPVVTDPGNQLDTVGSTVSLQLAVKSGTGIPQYTWSVTSGTLPTGLAMSTTGLISGSPTTVQPATSLTVTVTDGFGRTGTDTFTWAIVAPPTVTTPAAQSSKVGTATSLAIASTCANSPCSFALSGAPAGLSINATTGVISGTPTTVGTSSAVVVAVTDADSVSVATNPFTWTVTQAKPTISDPGTRSVTVGQNVSVPISFTCPTASCTVKITGTVPGLGLTGTATTTGNNTTVTGTVPSGSGTTYIAGTVQSSALTSGTSKAYAPVLTITDSSNTTVTSATGAWTAYVAPTIGNIGGAAVKVQQTPNVALAYTCPATPCTLTLTGTVTGLGLSTTANVTTANGTTSLTVSTTSGTVYYTGKVDNAAVPSGTSATYTPKVTIVDADAVGPSTTGTWTVAKAPLLTNPGTQAVETGQNVAIQMSTTCPNGGCTTWSAAAQAAGDTTYYTIAISNTGKITYTNAPAGTYTIRVTVTDSLNQSDTVYFTLKVVSAFAVAVPNQTTTKPTSGSTVVTLDASTLVNPTADGYTYALSGAPSWLTIDSNTGLMTATVTGTSATDTSITLTVTSTASATSTVATTFSWTIR